MSGRIRRLAYFGTDSFSSVVLDRLLNIMPSIIVDVVVPDARVTRSGGKVKERVCEVEQIARYRSLHLHHWSDLKDKGGSDRQCCPYDMGVVVSFGHMLPAPLIKWFPRRCVNAHPSLLPKLRGPSPIQHTILSGQTKTGVTIVELSENKFDAGKVLLQREIQVSPDINFSSLSGDLSYIAADLLVETVHNIDDLLVTGKTQNEEEATFAPKIRPENGYIQLHGASVVDCLRLHRAIGWQVGVWVLYGGRKVKLINMEEGSPDEQPGDPGHIVFNKELKKILLKLKDGSVAIGNLQFANKKSITAVDFNNAFLARKGSVSEFEPIYN